MMQNSVRSGISAVCYRLRYRNLRFAEKRAPSPGTALRAGRRGIAPGGEPPARPRLPRPSWPRSGEGAFGQLPEKPAGSVDLLAAYGNAFHVHAGGYALVAREGRQLLRELRAERDGALQ